MNSKQPKPRKRRGTTNLQLKGKRFGKLVVLEEMAERKSGHIMWKCLCDCGVEKIIRGASIKSGNTNSCGCLMTKVKKNERYGKLTAIERVKDDEGMIKWLCQCDCGSETLVFSGNLILNNTQSCGCLIPFNDQLTDEERVKRRKILPREGEISYTTWKRHVNQRDDFTCVICGYKHYKKYDLVSHHLDGFDWCEEKRHDVTNGVTLCGNTSDNNCHWRYHRIYGRSDSKREDFIEFYESETGKPFEINLVYK